MREIDRLTTERYALPSLLLMETAAAAAVRAIEGNLPGGVVGRRVLVLCGRGNNGGDGAALARILSLLGAFVDVVLFGCVEECQGDARINFEIARSLAQGGPTFTDSQRPEIADLCLIIPSNGRLTFTECPTENEWRRFRRVDFNDVAEVCVDAIFGTGLTRPVSGLHAEVVKDLNFTCEAGGKNHKHQSLIVSLDMPSGLNADSAALIGEAVRAHLTVTFTAPKPANVLPPAAHFNGQLVVADIGSPSSLIAEASSRLFLIESLEARTWLEQTRYTPDSYKNTHGHALVIAGSRQFSGAAVLCGDAAICAGAGLVTVASPASAIPAVASRLMPEVMTAALPETAEGTASEEAAGTVGRLTKRADVVAIGPGLSSEDEVTRRFVRSVVRQRLTPVVIDADGLNALAPWPAELHGSPESPLVLTPHEGEMRRLLGASDGGYDALADRVGVAREFAVNHQLILVLKGTRTLVAAPDGRVFVNPTGNAGLGTAGAGDTLTGIITSFLAQAYGTLKGQADALLAVLAAVYIGGLAGDLAAEALGMRTMTASDIRGHLSAAIRALDPRGEQP